MESGMADLLLILLGVAFSIGAIRARRLITSALWLAGVSALVSIVFFIYGARQVAVIELSVGAGLVTVLFVFAISISGDDAVDTQPVLPWPMFIGVSILFVFLLGWFVLPASVDSSASAGLENNMNEVLWNQRGSDVLVQVVMIFSGVLGLLGLLAEVKPPLEGSVAEEISAVRDRELQAIEEQFYGEGEIK
jgi:NADH:ubiquinone oxidoreductase subunit 6 (subunit J)